METQQQKITAVVKSPSKDAHLREGNGYSLNEIKQAGRTVNLLKELDIKIDYFRASVHSENVEKLKSIEVPKKKGKKRQPFVKKEKKKTPFKPKTEKKIMKKPVKPKAAPAKPTPPPKKKEKVKPIKVEKLQKIPKPTGAPLTNLSGLGATTAKKFIELGVNNIEDLVKENPEELAQLIKGVSLDRLSKWIEEGKELLKS
jgi:predicted flap endonuclease-1-like 5' DNA nuclease